MVAALEGKIGRMGPDGCLQQIIVFVFGATYQPGQRAPTLGIIKTKENKIEEGGGKTMCDRNRHLQGAVTQTTNGSLGARS